LGDGDAPVWTSNPTDINYACDTASDISMVITDWLAANGNGVISDASNFTVTHDYIGLDSCGIIGNALVTFIATDECENMAMATGNIMLRDTIAPNINPTARDTTVDFSNPSLTLNNWLTAHGYALATDFCTTIDNSDTSMHWMISNIDTVITCGNNVDYEATFVVMDDCGNVDSTMATYSVIDNSGLNVAGVNPDTTESCGEDIIKVNQWFIRISERDVFDQNGIKLRFSGINYKDRDGVEGTWLGQGQPFNASFIPVNDCNWYLDAEILYRDTCGQTGIDSARISFFDTIAPTINNIPLDTIVSCGEVPPATIIGITATDNCDTGLTITVSEIIDTTLSAINITRMWMATDDCDNSVVDTQFITVIDTVAPVLTDVPNDTISTCDDLPFSFLLLTATDNCTPEEDLFVDFFETDNQGTHPDSCDTYNYTITRTWIVVDAFNNADTSTQIITVVDTIAPTFTMPVDVTVSCERTDITATDNCSDAPIIQYLGETNTQNTDPTTCEFYNYAIVRTWRVTDACGNAAEFTQNINILDTIAPTIICPADIVMESDTILCGQNVLLPKPFYFDDCTGTTGSDSLSLFQNFTNAAVGDINEVPVDSLVFNFNLGGVAPNKTITSDVTVTINLNGVDGEGANEIFE